MIFLSVPPGFEYFPALRVCLFPFLPLLGTWGRLSAHSAYPSGGRVRGRDFCDVLSSHDPAPHFSGQNQLTMGISWWIQLSYQEHNQLQVRRIWIPGTKKRTSGRKRNRGSVYDLPRISASGEQRHPDGKGPGFAAGLLYHFTAGDEIYLPGAYRNKRRNQGPRA